MSKPIKVDDRTYHQLDVMRGPGETFSQVIDGLLLVRKRILLLIPVLERSLKYDQWREDQLKQISELQDQPADGTPADDHPGGA